MRPHSHFAESVVKHATPKKKEINKLSGFFAAYRRLVAQRPKLMVAVLFFSFASALTESFGLAIVYPILDSVVGKGNLQGPVWDTLRKIALSIPGASLTEGLLYLAIIVLFFKAIFQALNLFFTTLWINRLQEDWRLAALSHYLFGPYAAIVGERRGKILNNIFGETGTASKGSGATSDFYDQELLRHRTDRYALFAELENHHCAAGRHYRSHHNCTAARAAANATAWPQAHDLETGNDGCHRRANFRRKHNQVARCRKRRLGAPEATAAEAESDPGANGSNYKGSKFPARLYCVSHRGGGVYCSRACFRNSLPGISAT